MQWCGTARWSAAVGLAVPMSMPRYTCMESTATISTSSRCAAISIASADFPDAVGPSSDDVAAPSRPDQVVGGGAR